MFNIILLININQQQIGDNSHILDNVHNMQPKTYPSTGFIQRSLKPEQKGKNTPFERSSLQYHINQRTNRDNLHKNKALEQLNTI
jgi:hypothetical protein